jgi:peptidoglycan hydrolase-like protein with peptidoglycan-binding domain
MRRLILTTASVIVLGAGLSFTGTTSASAWSQSGMHSRMGHISQAEVKDVQQKLQADNLYSGKIDGRLGPQTRRAIADYQRQNRLRVTANLDRQTRDSLLGTTGTATPPASSKSTTQPPSQGAAPTPATPSTGTSATGK